MEIEMSPIDGIKGYGAINDDISEVPLSPQPPSPKIQGNRISFDILDDMNNELSSLPTWKEHSMRDSTVMEAILNSVNYFVGIGVLSIPYALRSGWICVLNMLVLGAVFGATGELIGLCQHKLSAKTYPDIAEAAFGFTGRIVVSVVYYVQLLFDLVLFFNLFVASANQIFGGELMLVLLCVTVLMVVETHIFTTMRRASALSLIGAVTGLVLCAALFLAFCVEIGLSAKSPSSSIPNVRVGDALVGPTLSTDSVAVSAPSMSLIRDSGSVPFVNDASSTTLLHLFGVISALRRTVSGAGVSTLAVSGGMPVGHTVWLNPSLKTQVVSFGIISFSYMGHAVWPSVFHSMVSPSHYSTVVWVTIALITVGYTLVAAFGYYLYGDDVHDNVSLDLRLGPWFVLFVNLLICLTVGAKFALAAFPIVECCEDLWDSAYVQSVLSGEMSGDTNSLTSGPIQSFVRMISLLVSFVKRFVSRSKQIVVSTLRRVRKRLFGHTPFTASEFRPISRRHRSITLSPVEETTPLLGHSGGRKEEVYEDGMATNSSVSTDYTDSDGFDALLEPIRIRQMRWKRKLRAIDSCSEQLVDHGSFAQTHSGSSIDDDDEAKCANNSTGIRANYFQYHPTTALPHIRKLNNTELESLNHMDEQDHDSEKTNREMDIQTTSTRTMFLLVVRTALPVLVLLLYLALPSFLQLVTIIGGVFGTLICLVFPLLFYLCLCRDEMSLAAAVVAWIGVGVGVAIAVAVSIASA